LGTATDEQTVEQLVTDIYREIEPDLSANGAGSQTFPDTGSFFSPQSRGEGSADRMIISVFGLDHPGIVAGVSQILAAAECSIVDINQTVVQGKFTMVIIADAARAQSSVADLKNRLRSEGVSHGTLVKLAERVG